MNKREDYIIYLVYSEKDLPFDKDAIGNFIRKQNDIAHKRGGTVYLKMIESEFVDSVPEDTDLVVSLSVNHSGGREIVEKLIGREDAPKIITFFKKESSDDPADESYYEYRDWLGSCEHFWTEYPEIEVVICKLLFFLQEQNVLNLSIKNGEMLLDDHIIMSISDFSGVNNNENLRSLRERFSVLDAKAEAMRHNGQDLEEEYAETIRERTDAYNQIRNISQNFFEALKNLENCPSKHLSEAHNAILSGDFDAAIRILDINNMRERARENDEKYEDNLAILNQQYLNERTALTREALTRANLLLMRVNDPERLTLAKETFEEAVRFSEGTIIEVNALQQYTLFIIAHDTVTKAIPYIERLESVAVKNEKEYATRAYIIKNFAVVLAKAGNESPREKFAEALALWDKACETSPGQYIYERACAYQDYASWLVEIENDRSYAKEILNHAIQTNDSLREFNECEAKISDIALRIIRVEYSDEANKTEEYKNLLNELAQMGDDDLCRTKLCIISVRKCMGLLYIQHDKMKEAADMLKAAIEIYNMLPEKHQVCYKDSYYLLNIYLGDALRNNSPNQAEKYYLCALKTLKDNKISFDGIDFCRFLAVYSSLAYLYAKLKRNDEAKKYLEMAEKEFEKIILDKSLLSFVGGVSMLADAYLKLGEKQKAKELLRKTVEEYKKYENGKELKVTGEIWSIFIKYIDCLSKEDDRAHCIDIYKMIKRFGKYPDLNDRSYATYCFRMRKLCHIIKKDADSEEFLRRGLKHFKNTIKDYSEHDIITYFTEVKNLLKLLNKKPNGKKLAINMLKEEKEFAKLNSLSWKNTDVFGYICVLLKNIYLSEGLESSALKLQKEYEQLKKEIDDANGG